MLQLNQSHRPACLIQSDSTVGSWLHHKHGAHLLLYTQRPVSSNSFATLDYLLQACLPSSTKSDRVGTHLVWHLKPPPLSADVVGSRASQVPALTCAYPTTGR